MKKWLGFFLVVALLAATLAVLPVHGEEKIYENVIRLHVLANSDSAADQALKLRVRDAVLAETSVLLEGVTDRDAAADKLAASLDGVRAAAERELRAAGSDQAVAVTLTRENYPTRTYEKLAFPAGEYLSLRVLLGDAAGQNWWCVLFPPLCLTAATTESKVAAETAFLAAGLTGEQYRIITDSDNTKYKLRFKILEIAEEVLQR